MCATNVANSKIRVLQSQLDSLREAQLEILHLCEALEKLKETLSEEMNKNFPKTTVEWYTTVCFDG